MWTCPRRRRCRPSAVGRADADGVRGGGGPGRGRSVFRSTVDMASAPVRRGALPVLPVPSCRRWRRCATSLLAPRCCRSPVTGPSGSVGDAPRPDSLGGLARRCATPPAADPADAAAAGPTTPVVERPAPRLYGDSGLPAPGGRIGLDRPGVDYDGGDARAGRAACPRAQSRATDVRARPGRGSWLYDVNWTDRSRLGPG